MENLHERVLDFDFTSVFDPVKISQTLGLASSCDELRNCIIASLWRIAGKLAGVCITLLTNTDLGEPTGKPTDVYCLKKTRRALVENLSATAAWKGEPPLLFGKESLTGKPVCHYSMKSRELSGVVEAKPRRNCARGGNLCLGIQNRVDQRSISCLGHVKFRHGTEDYGSIQCSGTKPKQARFYEWPKRMKLVFLRPDLRPQRSKSIKKTEPSFVSVLFRRSIPKISPFSSLALSFNSLVLLLRERSRKPLHKSTPIL
ncbi:hypothetical protein AVEN_65509-1 [Araneus ventricosus]|uniref:Uncharacterized protein n=1 Tax=Araneus ventricosus TaxID=182803 RepID=A0A4Y2FEZ3_ARAVE|nr:hypothetical protein AVEN_65509-1 [Araneus ventricosus]